MWPKPIQHLKQFPFLGSVLKSWWGFGLKPIQHWEDVRCWGKTFQIEVGRVAQTHLTFETISRFWEVFSWWGLGLKPIQHWGDFCFGGKTFQIEVGRVAQTYPTFETMSVFGRCSQILVGLGDQTHPTLGRFLFWGENFPN